MELFEPLARWPWALKGAAPALLETYRSIVAATSIVQRRHRGIHRDLNVTRWKLPGLDFTKLLYADIIAIVTNNFSDTDRIVGKIEEHA